MSFVWAVITGTITYVAIVGLYLTLLHHPDGPGGVA
jgi:hypothetical protein